MQTTGFEWSDLVDDAVERSGGHEVTAENMLSLRRSLRLLTERWTAKGYNTWRVISTRVGSATTPSESLRLPANIDDIIVANAITQSGTESPMVRITAAQYAQLSTKSTLGQSSQWYLGRTDAPVLFRYPTGPCPLSLWAVARPAAFDAYEDGDSDVPGRWLEAMVLGLAYDLSRKRFPYNEELIARLKGEYAEAEFIAQNADRDRAPYTYRVAHRWGR